ncbi:MAG: DUF998 domain-containing protein [Halolamina sp.]
MGRILARPCCDVPSTSIPRSRRQWARRSGPVAAAVTIGSLLAATVISPTFSWWASALSDLGTTGTSAWLFNGGLLVGGLLGLPYAWALWTAAADPLGYLRATTFVGSLLAMAGVGLFPAGRPPHLPLAVAFFALASLTLLVDGVARLRLLTGKLTLGFGIASPLSWPVWGLWLAPTGGIAVPEFVGAALFALWIGLLSPERPGQLG